MQNVENFYTKNKAEIGPRFEVIFDEDEVSLEVPEDGITLPNGWSLLPLVYPTKVRIWVVILIIIIYIYICNSYYTPAKDVSDLLHEAGVQ